MGWVWSVLTKIRDKLLSIRKTEDWSGTGDVGIVSVEEPGRILSSEFSTHLKT